MAKKHAGEAGNPLAQKRTRDGMSIQSMLLVMLMLVSLLTSIVVGAIGYVNGSDSLRDAAFDKLAGARDARVREVESLFDRIVSTIKLQSRSPDTVSALRDLTAGFDELGEIELDEERTAKLTDYYSEVFAPQLAELTGREVDPGSFVPSGAAARYLQSYYTAPYTSFGESLEVSDAGDGSAWSAANALHHPQFKRMARLLEYEDILLIDVRGNIVYSAYKGADLGTNVADGPYAHSNLGTAYRQALAANILDTVIITDFGDYPASLTTAAAWAVSPIADGSTIIGAFAIELPIDRIDDAMTANRSWRTSGLGETGEAYLVGADQMMRSVSRELLEDANRYRADAVAAGTPAATADLIVAQGSTLLLQPVHTEAAARAIAGETGTVIGHSYLGKETLAAFAPVRLDGLTWAIVAEFETSEAFAPVGEFTRNLILSTLALQIFVSLLSLVLAQPIIRPLGKLRAAAARIAAGEEGVTVDAGTSDELADVAAAFNDMSRSLQTKAQLLDEQVAENERLLRHLMPEAVAKRYRQGDANVVEEHAEVTVLYAEIVGFDEYSRGLDSGAALDALNEILLSFDEAAERLGVERVRSTRSGYLASCGLTVPRVDNTRRTVELALELQRILNRFAAQRGVRLGLQAGIDTGTVTSGLVGRSHMVYDLWGDALSLALRLQSGTGEPGIVVTQSVIDHLPDGIRFDAAGTLDTASGRQSVWRIRQEHDGD